mmetsp:Transcript_14926/g.42309  ORF Transcript_14926/g.42309 Transcript_14926/m.42309 type:complete len:257 (+) Transcript_14926:748-1518(+)
MTSSRATARKSTSTGAFGDSSAATKSMCAAAPLTLRMSYPARSFSSARSWTPSWTSSIAVTKVTTPYSRPLRAPPPTRPFSRGPSSPASQVPAQHRRARPGCSPRPPCVAWVSCHSTRRFATSARASTGPTNLRISASSLPVAPSMKQPPTIRAFDAPSCCRLCWVSSIAWGPVGSRGLPSLCPFPSHVRQVADLPRRRPKCCIPLHGRYWSSFRPPHSFWLLLRLFQFFPYFISGRRFALHSPLTFNEICKYQIR